MARSLKQGCNDHIEELAIIKDKIVPSKVKQISNKRTKTSQATDKSKKKGQTAEEKKELFNNMQENKIIQDEINTDNKENNSTGRKTAGKKICWW